MQVIRTIGNKLRPIGHAHVTGTTLKICLARQSQNIDSVHLVTVSVDEHFLHVKTKSGNFAGNFRNFHFPEKLQTAAGNVIVSVDIIMIGNMILPSPCGFGMSSEWSLLGQSKYL